MNNPQTSLSQLRANLDTIKTAAQVMLDNGMPPEALVKSQNAVNAMESKLRASETEETSTEVLKAVESIVRQHADSKLFRNRSLKVEDKGSGPFTHWIIKDSADDDKINFVQVPDKPKAGNACDLATISADALRAELDRRETASAQQEKEQDNAGDDS